MRKLSEEYLLEENLLLKIRGGLSDSLKLIWSDWDLLCKQMCKKVEDGQTDDLSSLIEELDLLKEVPLWVRGAKGLIKTNIYDYYQYYMDPRVRALWGELHEKTLISLLHESGPYVHIQSMRWLDETTYLKFIQLKILKGLERTRSFRLRSDIPGRVVFNNNPINGLGVSISSVNSKGLLIEVQGRGNFIKFISKQEMRLDLDLEKLKKDDFFKHFCSKKIKNKLTLSFSKDAFNSLDNAKISDGNTYYLFLSFNKVSGDYKELASSFNKIEEEALLKLVG